MPRPADTPTVHRHIPHVLSVPENGEITVCFETPIDGILTHRNGTGKEPCPGEAECSKSIHRTKLTYYGYCCVRLYVPGRSLWVPEVLEVTEHLEEHLRGRYLPGELWRLWRHLGRHKTRPCTGQWLETRSIDGVFDPWDYKAVVHRVYHTPLIVWGQANPVPPRVQVDAVSAPPPPGVEQPPPRQPTGRPIADSLKLARLKRGEYFAPDDPVHQLLQEEEAARGNGRSH